MAVRAEKPLIELHGGQDIQFTPYQRRFKESLPVVGHLFAEKTVRNLWTDNYTKAVSEAVNYGITLIKSSPESEFKHKSTWFVSKSNNFRIFNTSVATYENGTGSGFELRINAESEDGGIMGYDFKDPDPYHNTGNHFSSLNYSNLWLPNERARGLLEEFMHSKVDQNATNSIQKVLIRNFGREKNVNIGNAAEIGRLSIPTSLPFIPRI